MPARSRAQQKAAGAALSAKRGATPKSKLNGASRDMAKSMNEQQLEELASTEGKALPARKVAKKATARKATRKVAKRSARKAAAPAKAARKTPSRKAPQTRQDKKRAANRVLLRKRAAKKAGAG
jgi:hypothetical protein